MRRLTIWTLALTMLAFSAPAALAAAPKKSAEERFAKMDTNNDKKLSEEEFIGKKSGDMKTKAEKRFGKLDKNNDKSLSLEEFNVPPKKKAA